MKEKKTMKKINLDIKDFRNDASNDTIKTTIAITEKQRQFIKDNNINLSKLVREIIESIMEDQ